VGVELKVFAQPAFLLALITEELREGEPFDRLSVVARVRGDHTGQRRRHFRSQRHGAVAFVGEVVELADDFVAALGGVELERFEWRAVVFAEAVAARDGTPVVEDVITHVRAPSRVAGRERFGIKVAETRQSFHTGSYPQRGAKSTGKKTRATNVASQQSAGSQETESARQAGGRSAKQLRPATVSSLGCRRGRL